MAVETATLTPIEMTGVQTRLNEEEEQALIRVLRESNALATGVEGDQLEIHALTWQDVDGREEDEMDRLVSIVEGAS